MLQFGTKNSRRAWHVIPAQEVKVINDFFCFGNESLRFENSYHTACESVVCLIISTFPDYRRFSTYPPPVSMHALGQHTIRTTVFSKRQSLQNNLYLYYLIVLLYLTINLSTR